MVERQRNPRNAPRPGHTATGAVAGRAAVEKLLKARSIAGRENCRVDVGRSLGLSGYFFRRLKFYIQSVTIVLPGWAAVVGAAHFHQEGPDTLNRHEDQ